MRRATLLSIVIALLGAVPLVTLPTDAGKQQVALQLTLPGTNTPPPLPLVFATNTPVGPTATPTLTVTPSLTDTPSLTPTATPTFTATFTPTFTPSDTPTPTNTPTPTPTP